MSAWNCFLSASDRASYSGLFASCMSCLESCSRQKSCTPAAPGCLGKVQLLPEVQKCIHDARRRSYLVLSASLAPRADKVASAVCNERAVDIPDCPGRSYRRCTRKQHIYPGEEKRERCLQSDSSWEVLRFGASANMAVQGVASPRLRQMARRAP
uniref:Uncharacterized protein n=1 Tax=Rhipicephalus zambeziensis TaxID=60191 RepID=A0A224YA90_9ACAR